MRSHGLAILGGALALALPAAALEGWELARESEGIRVYTRAVPGSGFREFRGETVIDAELNQLMALLDDTPAFVDWMYSSKSALLLHEVDLLDRYQYLSQDFPWPAADRDMILRNRIRQDPETRVTTVTLEAVGARDLPERVRDRVPETDGEVRVTELAGFFELTPLEDGRTRVVYQLHLDPVGSLPPALVNARLVDNPFETLKGMREVIQRAKYRCFRPF